MDQGSWFLWLAHDRSIFSFIGHELSPFINISLEIFVENFLTQFLGIFRRTKK